MLTATIPILAALLGLVLYVLPWNPKGEEIGRILYAAGLLVALFELAHVRWSLAG